jgi:Tfp pilus assembly protein PilX
MLQPELKIRRARGFLLIVAILVLVVVAVAIASLGNMTSADVRSSSGHAQSEQGYFAATSGIEYAKSLFLTGTACGAGLNTTGSVGNGTFTVSNTTQYAPAPTNTAAGGVNATATTIPVVSTVGYAAYGRIVIDSEEMYYAGISGNNFINVVRGYSNTIAATHGTVTPVPVMQSLCNIESTGTVGSAKRKLTANMPLQFYKAGVITKAAAAGATPYTGIGFRPNVVIFYWTEQIATGLTANNVGVSAGVGFATAANQYAAATGMRDNIAPTSNGRSRSSTDAVIFQTVTAAPLLLAKANLQSMDSDGFTLNWNVNGNATAYLINYIALGGDTQGFVGNFDMNNATGNQPITGTGFQPAFVMFVHAGDGATTAPNDLDAQFGIGFAQSATSRGAMVYAGETAQATSSSRWQQLTTKVILFLSHAAPPVAAGQADLFSMDSNGFTINVTTASGVGNWNVGYLALRGARVGVGTFNQPAAAGAQTPVSNLAFEPQGVMLASRNLATALTLAAGRTSIGAGGGSTIVDGNIWFQERSALATSDANAYNDATNIISMGLNTSTASVAQASLTSLQLGGFTLTWGLANAVARQILYWAIGPRDYDDTKELY